MRKKDIKLSKANITAYIALILTLVAATLFIASLVFTAYALEGFLAVPASVLIIANLCAVAAVVLSLYALIRGGSKKISITSLVVSLFVLSLPYLATILVI